MKYLKKKSGKILLATGLAFSMAACGVTDNKEKTNAESSKQQNNNNDSSNNNNSNANNSNGNNNNNSNANNSNGNNNNSNANNSNGNNNNNSNANNSNGNNNTNTNNEWGTNNSNNSNNNSNNNEQKPNQNQEQSATSVTLEQHGIIVTVHKVEQADNIVRVKYTINNTTNQTIFSGAPGAKIEQNGKKYNTIRFQRELGSKRIYCSSYKCRWNKPLFIERYNK